MNSQSILSIAAAIATIVGTYFIFKKAHLEGWKAIIPFYNVYTEYKMVWNTKMFWTCLGSALVAGTGLGIAHILTKTSPVAALVLILIAFVAAIYALVVEVKESYRLSKAFGHGKGFCVGLVFLNPIFRLILGFDQSQYQEA
ncbi:MAG: hypothetical protein KBT48_03260 [Firmicutes bacterium]|nr:hypothetical protein [Bacillota bacterium]